MKYKKKSLYNILFFIASSLFFLIQTNLSVVEAANESKISVNLYANVNPNDGVLSLDVPDLLSNKMNLSFLGKRGSIYHMSFLNTKYIEVTISRGGKTIFTASANGGTKQDDFIDKINKLSVLKGDILHLYLREPDKQRIMNVFNGQPSLLEDKKLYLKPDMFYMITQDGFIPMNNAISLRTYSDDLNNIYTYVNTFLTEAVVGYSYTYTSADGKQFQPLSVFHSALPTEERFILSQYEVGLDHTLTVPKNKVSAYGKTTFGEMNTKVKAIQVANGTIYRTYFNDNDKFIIWNKGIGYSVKDLTQKINYFELTEGNGLMELDFYKVKPKNVILELGSDPEKIGVADASNISSYPSLSASFKTDIKTDKIGIYDQPILIKQNLVTNNNYLQSEITSKVTIVDTTKPTAIAKVDTEIPIYDSLPANPADLLDNIQDNSDVTTLKIDYLDENLDTSVPGIKNVKIRLTDASGNFSDIEVAIRIVPGLLTIASVPNLNFGKIMLGVPTKNLNQETSMIEINDFRGTKEGWTLQASKSNFANQEGRELYSNITLTNGIISSPDQIAEGVNLYNVTLNDSSQTIIQANKNYGMKKWIATFKNENIFLDSISPDARIGSYESIINWTLLNVP